MNGPSHYSQCPHHRERDGVVMCGDPCAPRDCPRPGLCCRECLELWGCEWECPAAASSAARELKGGAEQ